MGHFEAQVLMAVLRGGENAYGVSVVAEIEARTGKRPSSGATYTTLERLRQKGYLTTREGEPTPERGGRRKQYYRVTGLGDAALNEVLNGIGRLSRGLRITGGASA